MEGGVPGFVSMVHPLEHLHGLLFLAFLEEHRHIHVQYIAHVALSTQQPPHLAGENVKLSSYLAQYPTHRIAQSSLQLLPGRPVQSDTILTTMGNF